MSKIHKIKSFDSFTEELQARKPNIVVVQVERQLERGHFRKSFRPLASQLGDFRNGLLYSVQAKRQRDYVEPLSTAFQSEPGEDNYSERYRRAAQILLAGEVRVGLLRTALPDTEVYLAGPNLLDPMDEQGLRFLHKQAQEYGIELPDFVV